MPPSIFSIHYNEIQQEYYSQPTKCAWKSFVPLYFVRRNIVEGLKYTFAQHKKKPNTYIWDESLLKIAIQLKHYECANYLIRKECPGYTQLFVYVCQENIQEIANYYFHTYPHLITVTHLRTFGLLHKNYEVIYQFINYIPQQNVQRLVYYYLYYLSPEEEVDMELLVFLQEHMGSHKLKYPEIHEITQKSADIAFQVLRLFRENINTYDDVQTLCVKKSKLFRLVYTENNLFPIDYSELLRVSVDENNITKVCLACENMTQSEKVNSHAVYHAIYYNKPDLFDLLVNTYAFPISMSYCLLSMQRLTQTPVFFVTLIKWFLRNHPERVPGLRMSILEVYSRENTNLSGINVEDDELFSFFDGMDIQDIRERIKSIRMKWLLSNGVLEDVIVDIKKYVISEYL